MLKLSHGAMNLAAFEERMLREALAQQELLDEWKRMERALGGSAIVEALRAQGGVRKMIEEAARPEMDLIREHQDLMSGHTFAREAAALASAGSFARDAVKMLEQVSGAEALRMASARLASEGTGVEALSRAAETHSMQYALRELERHAAGYSTYNALAKEWGGIDSLFAETLRNASVHASVETTIKNAVRIETPWIDALAPARSFEAYAALSSIAETVRGLHSRDETCAAHLRALTGSWVPADPVAFAMQEAAERTAAFLDSGLDPRIFDIPPPAFPDMARATGLVPAQPVRVRATREQRKSAVLIEASGSLSDDATLQVRSAERMLRGELRSRMPPHFGQNWIKQRVPGPLRKEWEDREQKRRRRGRSTDLLDFAYFGDLVQVIMQKGVWETAFEPSVNMKKEEFQVCTSRLIEIRNVLSHAGDLEVTEFIWCFSEVTQLRHAFGFGVDEEFDD